jgi:polysaccharide export outer membrane protein
MFKAQHILGLLAASLFMFGCSSNKLPQATIFPSATSSIQDYKYLIGPGDSLNIFVWRNPEVSGTFVVRPDGMITTSLVEDIKVTGMTPTELARKIEEVLGQYIKSPIVTVSVGGFQGPYSEQVRIIGEASNPKAVNYRQNMTLLDLMIDVGGLTEFADGNGAVLIRVEQGKQLEYNVLLDDLVKKGDIRANVDILPGDIIIVPEDWF